jgi:polar amino acid transport system substrate-binding protein
MVRGWWRGAIVAVCLLGGVAGAAAQDRLVWRVGTGRDYGPLANSSYRSQGGILTELVRRVLVLAGDEVLLNFADWSEVDIGLQGGQLEAAFPYVRTAAREARFLFSDPIWQAQRIVFVRADLDWRFDGVASLTDRVLCHPDGWVLPAEVEELAVKGRVRVVRRETLPDCVRLIRRGKADLFIINDAVGEAAVLAAGVPAGSIRREPQIYGLTNLHLVVDRTLRDGQARIDRFNRAFTAFRAAGGYDALPKP